MSCTKRYWNSPLIIDTSYLRYPDFLSFRLLKGYLDISYFEKLEKYMKFFSSYRSLNSYQLQEPTDSGFTLKEIEKIKVEEIPENLIEEEIKILSQGMPEDEAKKNKAKLYYKDDLAK